jgi:hypothetical protein
VKVIQQIGFTQGEQDAAVILSQFDFIINSCFLYLLSIALYRRSRISCPYILQVKALEPLRDRVIMVMEYADSKVFPSCSLKSIPIFCVLQSLEALLKKKKKLSEEEAKYFMSQISFCSLPFSSECHFPHVTHRSYFL